MKAIQKTLKNPGVTSLLIANIITLVIFAFKPGNVMQILWIYLVQSFLAALFYYKRISKIRLLELAYIRTHKPKKTAAFKKEIERQIPGEQLIFLIICVSPLLVLLIFFLNATLLGPGSEPVNGDAYLYTSINVYIVALGSFAFLVEQLIEYKYDQHLAKTGEALKNRYTTFYRAILGMLPVITILVFGSVLFQFFGSAAVFAGFMIAKTFVEATIQVKTAQ